MVKYALLLLVISGCGLSKPSIPDFDADIWSDDTKGCQGNRKILAPTLLEYKDMLLGYNQNEIKYYLGKPDEQELYDRSQTFFKYYISNHKDCMLDSSGASVVLQVRFSALNRSNEVFFENFTQN